MSEQMPDRVGVHVAEQIDANDVSHDEYIVTSASFTAPKQMPPRKSHAVYLRADLHEKALAEARGEVEKWKAVAMYLHDPWIAQINERLLTSGEAENLARARKMYAEALKAALKEGA